MYHAQIMQSGKVALGAYNVCTIISHAVEKLVLRWIHWINCCLLTADDNDMRIMMDAA